MTKTKLELIPYPDIQILFEKVTSDGIFFISNRYSKVKNKHLKSLPKSRIKILYT